jgi:hypothetical protein
VVLFLMTPPFGLSGGRDGTGRPDSDRAGLTAASRRIGRSDLRTLLRRCAHGATFAQAAEERLKPA